MSERINVNGIHHVRLTVANMDAARAFYTEVLGFDVLMEMPPGVLLTNGQFLLGLRLAPAAEAGNHDDRFDENRVGLDHLSFAVNSREDLDEAVRILDEKNVPHSDINDLGADFGLYILVFRDPDNFQLELTAPYS